MGYWRNTRRVLARTHEGEHARDLHRAWNLELLAAHQPGELTDTVRLRLAWVLLQLIAAELGETS